MAMNKTFKREGGASSSAAAERASGGPASRKVRSQKAGRRQWLLIMGIQIRTHAKVQGLKRFVDSQGYPGASYGRAVSADQEGTRRGSTRAPERVAQGGRHRPRGCAQMLHDSYTVANGIDAAAVKEP